MNKLKSQKKEAVISALVEGNSIRSTERMTGVHRDTIMRLLVDTGLHCESLLNYSMRDLSCQRVQVDEIWCYVGKKQRHLTATDDFTRMGDKWVFVGIDADTKLVPCYRIGERNPTVATAFLRDLESRLTNRIQLSSDALRAYVIAVESVFGREVDYGQIVKTYESEPIGAGRYSPPHVVSAERYAIVGRPDVAHISTSLNRAAKFDHAHADAPVHPPHQRFLQEVREPEGSRRAALCPLQLLPCSSKPARHASDGRRCF